ncbi:hypothetical protein [Amycolatopsis azurea]|uniref:hypothetical protein n=1 Tax=Amycolatopsis azurea TaxID=36819 RepID=UPI00117764CD|nr:hypothetical protein [Amycolatopsis azurea]
MRPWSAIATIIVLTGSTLLGVAGFSSATSAKDDAVSAVGRVCVTVVGEAPADGADPAESTTCGASVGDPAIQTAVAGKTLLMEWFYHANNNPSDLYRYYGTAGPCDTSGYKIKVTGQWDNNISGFNTWNDCNEVLGYDAPNFAGAHGYWDGTKNPCVCVVAHWVGPDWNDRISSFHIRFKR